MENRMDFTLWEDWITVSITDATYTKRATQWPGKYLDLADIETVTVRVNLVSISGGTFQVETAVSKEGPWSYLKSWVTPVMDDTVTFTPWKLTDLGNTVERFLRWSFVPTSVNGYATFRLRFMTGGPVFQTTVEQRVVQKAGEVHSITLASGHKTVG